MGILDDGEKIFAIAGGAAGVALLLITWVELRRKNPPGEKRLELIRVALYTLFYLAMILYAIAGFLFDWHPLSFEFEWNWGSSPD